MGSGGGTPKRILMEVQNRLDPTSPRTPKIVRHILPKGSIHVISPLSSPISPMANLKLLTKVASVFSETNPQSQPTNEKYSRRLRSLSFICKKFLEIYRWDLPEGKSESISLVSLANRLGIKKRRVYDVINVVASLNLAVKVCKDRYRWLGAQNLHRSLANLKAYALQNNFHVQLEALMESDPELNWTSGKRQWNSTDQEPKGMQPLRVQEVVAGMPPFDHNRIGVLSQKFIMLFLVAREGTSLSLLLLSKLILSSDIQYKTGVRRLYDVANALEALGLIAKSDDPSARRPSFVYQGPRIDSSGSTTGIHVECVSENSFDAPDSELDCSQDTSIDHLLEVECLEVAASGTRTILDAVDSLEGKPPAKKRLIFSTDESCLSNGGIEPEGSILRRSVIQRDTPGSTSASISVKNKFSRLPGLKDAKPVLVSSSSSRLLGDEEAAYYRSKITSTQCHPTFLVVRSANQLTFRLK